MRLQVARVHDSDVYRDLGRVPELYRRDGKGRVIAEGRICEVSVGGRRVLLSLRGQLDNPANRTIYLDELTRSRLALTVNDEADFEFQPVRWWGRLRWAWCASDPASRLAVKLAVWSVVLGCIGVALGVLSLWLAVK